jgi:hypothetical protein
MKSFIIKAVLLLALIAALLFSLNRIQALKRECDRLQSNQSVLIEKSQSDAAEKQKYKVSDSLSAIKVRELELTLDEYKAYRAKDLQLIKRLKDGKSSDVSKVVSPELITNNELSLDLSDSLMIDTLHNRVAVLKCFDYNSEYCTVSGCVDVESDTVDIQVCNRESLKVIETITYKRFLGFLWKTKKIKSKQVDVVSYNPNTEIVSCDYVSITK